MRSFLFCIGVRLEIILAWISLQLIYNIHITEETFLGQSETQTYTVRTKLLKVNKFNVPFWAALFLWSCTNPFSHRCPGYSSCNVITRTCAAQFMHCTWQSVFFFSSPFAFKNINDLQHQGLSIVQLWQGKLDKKKLGNIMISTLSRQ